MSVMYFERRYLRDVDDDVLDNMNLPELKNFIRTQLGVPVPTHAKHKNNALALVRQRRHADPMRVVTLPRLSYDARNELIVGDVLVDGSGSGKPPLPILGVYPTRGAAHDRGGVRVANFGYEEVFPVMRKIGPVLQPLKAQGQTAWYRARRDTNAVPVASGSSASTAYQASPASTSSNNTASTSHWPRGGGMRLVTLPTDEELAASALHELHNRVSSRNHGAAIILQRLPTGRR